jgi:hypothetical protein
MKKYILAVLMLLFFGTNGIGATVTTAGSGAWSSTTDNAPWPGGTLPSAGDDVVIANTHVVTLNMVRVPAVTGTFNSLSGTGTGQITIDMSATGLNASAEIVATNITCGTSTAFIYMSVASANTLTLTGNLTGGTGTAAVGYKGNAANLNVTVTGNVTGGSGNRAHGISLANSMGTLTIGGNILAGNTASTRSHGIYFADTYGATAVVFAAGTILTDRVGGVAYVGPQPTWSPGATAYISTGGKTWYWDNTDPLKANVKTETHYHFQGVANDGELAAGGGGAWGF